MIAHELDISKLPDKILKRHGFRKWVKNRHRYTHGLKINASHTLLYDNTGFLTWKRRRTPKGRLFDVILIPEPIRTEKALKRIIERIEAKYS